MSKIVPQRTCIGCQTKKPKKELVRIIVGENNNLMIDITGKRGGRGAYLCKLKTKNSLAALAAGRQAAGQAKLKADEKCLEMAIEKKSFQRAFKRKVNTNNLWQNRPKRNQKNQNFNSVPQ